MTKPLGIIELLTRIGEQHIRLQNLVESATNFTLKGKRGHQETAITFLTDQMDPSEIFRKNARNVGLVLWLPTELVEAAKAAHASEADVARTGEHLTYLSTACVHKLHARCRQACKFCGKPCACSCHAVVPATMVSEP